MHWQVSYGLCRPRLRGRLVPAPPQARLTGDPANGMPDWTVLGERPGEEIAFGAVVVFCGADISWRPVPPEMVASFSEPGYGKIACNFSVRPYGTQRCVLTFDCRVVLTDPGSRHRFNRYWLLVRPLVGHIMCAALAAAAIQATHVAAPAHT